MSENFNVETSFNTTGNASIQQISSSGLGNITTSGTVNVDGLSSNGNVSIGTPYFPSFGNSSLPVSNLYLQNLNLNTGGTLDFNYQGSLSGVVSPLNLVNNYPTITFDFPQQAVTLGTLASIFSTNKPYAMGASSAIITVNGVYPTQSSFDFNINQIFVVNPGNFGITLNYTGVNGNPSIQNSFIPNVVYYIYQLSGTILMQFPPNTVVVYGVGIFSNMYIHGDSSNPAIWSCSIKFLYDGTYIQVLGSLGLASGAFY